MHKDKVPGGHRQGPPAAVGAIGSGGAGRKGMAEPMSAGEIEDVLASIRRLVSQDGRVRPQPAEAAPHAPPAPPGKLILTPALRVVEPARPQPAAQAARDDLWDDDAAQDDAAQDGAAQDDAAQDGDGGDGAWDAPALAPSQAAAVAATIARLVPDWDDEAAPATRLSWVEVAAGLEDEPADPPRFVHRGSPPPPEPEPEQPALIGTSEDVLDEAVLREIVREVLREELQGHLGERITRNIRKLVRAEVHRSIALRDYD